jgi:hypothetical protein
MVALTPLTVSGGKHRKERRRSVDRQEIRQPARLKLMRTFVDIVHAGGIGPAARTRTPLSGPRLGGGRNGTDLKWAGLL